MAQRTYDSGCTGDAYGIRCSVLSTSVAVAIDPADASDYQRRYGRQGRLDRVRNAAGTGYVTASWSFCDDHPAGASERYGAGVSATPYAISDRNGMSYGIARDVVRGERKRGKTRSTPTPRVR